MISTHRTNNNIAILISPGFAESEVVYCLSQMRASGLPISLVGVSNGLIHSQHGLVVSPDYSLNELTNDTPFRLLIIPGNYECVTNLLTSPDFHRQAENNILNEGFVAILTSAEAALNQVNLFTTPTDRIVRQQKQPLDAFCQQLIKIASAV